MGAVYIDELPPIQVSDSLILIDGYHRLKAYEKAGKEEIPCDIIECKSEKEIYFKSIKANSEHGLELSSTEKKSIAIKLCGTQPDKDIWTMLSVPETVQTLGLGKQKHNKLLPAVEPFGVLVSFKVINTFFKPIPTNELQKL